MGLDYIIVQSQLTDGNGRTSEKTKIETRDVWYRLCHWSD